MWSSNSKESSCTKAKWFTKTWIRGGTSPSPIPSETESTPWKFGWGPLVWTEDAEVVFSYQGTQYLCTTFITFSLMLLQVYDKNRTSDDFMGSSTISLKNLELYKWGKINSFESYFRESIIIKLSLSDHHFECPSPSLHRTYEMELRLDDPKSKEDDMGVILVDVCMMFRDATIKRSPVRIFPIWEKYLLIPSLPWIVCTDSCYYFFSHSDGHRRRTRYGICASLHLPLNLNLYPECHQYF